MTSNSPSITPKAGDALLLVDVQNDFLPGGSLAVPRGDEVIPPLNRLITSFSRRSLPIFATRDWHPAGHCSFRERGGPWPPHCVAATHGAAFPANLALPHAANIVSKATTADRDSYSGFGDTELHYQLRTAGARRLFVGGLATDYCVLNTVRDAVAKGYQVLLLRDAIRAVDVQPEDGQRALIQMHTLGATLIESTEVSD